MLAERQGPQPGIRCAMCCDVHPPATALKLSQVRALVGSGSLRERERQQAVGGQREWLAGQGGNPGRWLRGFGVISVGRKTELALTWGYARVPGQIRVGKMLPSGTPGLLALAIPQPAGCSSILPAPMRKRRPDRVRCCRCPPGRVRGNASKCVCAFCLSALFGTAWHCLAPSGTVLHGRVHSWDTCNLPVAAVDDAPKPSQPLKIMPAAPFCAFFLSAFLPYRQAYCVVSALMGLLALGISDEDHRGTTESDQCKLNPRREFAGSTRVRWRYL
ncbi:uncharacterized protein K441DRAFT_676155 [Cenococcum geophilum 1.58]|uniref:uncharacterized protein n=1 Tax=Cenococcum geophilum 1.58 TaxID=794803 RepID=UPI00358DF5B2|nr:hypothetical protein K441DRAFT_676155 [Cenococcum geophilum 1.58]